MLEMIIGLFFCFILFPLAVYFALAVHYVPAPFKWVIEINLPGKDATGKKRKGTEKKVWEPGLHLLKVPIRPFMFVKSRIITNNQTEVLRVGEVEGAGTSGVVEIKDTSVGVIVQIVFQVTDIIKATYDIADYRNAVINKIDSLIRQYLGGKTLDEALKHETKVEMITDVMEGAAAKMREWGVELKDVSIIDFIIDEETEKMRREILKASKEADAAELRADGSRRAKIKEAQGDAEATEIRAKAEKIRQALVGEGQGEYIKAIADKTGSSVEEVMAFIRSEQFFEAIKGSTIFSMSEGGGINFPAGFAAVFKAFSEGMKNAKGGGTT